MSYAAQQTPAFTDTGIDFDLAWRPWFRSCCIDREVGQTRVMITSDAKLERLGKTWKRRGAFWRRA
jgi:hypothetical protein